MTDDYEGTRALQIAQMRVVKVGKKPVEVSDKGVERIIGLWRLLGRRKRPSFAVATSVETENDTFAVKLVG